MVLFRKKRDFTIPPTGLDTVETVTLGGVEQSILIQATDPTHPVLLFVHGGPCMPVPGVASRGQDYAVAITTKELVQHFVVVFWDQRAAGKSFHPSIPQESIRMEQFFKDCDELIDVLRSRFDQKKVFLAAHSWGTVIGLTVATRSPEKLHAYMGVSQILNWTENDQFCYDWLHARAIQSNDRRTLNALEKIGQPPYTHNLQNWLSFRKLLVANNSMIYKSKTVKHPGMLGGMKIFLRSPDYSWKDIYHAFKSAYDLTYTKEIIEDFAKINLTAIEKVDVPVFFFHGKRDIHLDWKPVEAFVEKLDAPYGKELILYPNSSHMFHPEEARQIEGSVIGIAKGILARELSEHQAVFE
ncbi:alpha/beta hydrolase [Sporosarcina sp. 179-K 3D1 HS]|uniref:alpha/beta fold hydrolase n=1 Tax=Sporosarcina sp. 179-K 3D1 HS TaxID=3232169 RepID=UPI00399F17DF